MLLAEHSLVVERVNGMEVTRATLQQLAISSILSKKGGTLFQKEINGLSIETFAFELDEPEGPDEDDPEE